MRPERGYDGCAARGADAALAGFTGRGQQIRRPHAVSHRFTEQQLRSVVRALDAAGVPVIEVTHGDGLGGSSFAYGLSLVDDIELIAAAADEATQAKIAVLMLPGLGTSTDLARAFGAGATVARIAAHCTEADLSIQHLRAARHLGMQTAGILTLSHRASPHKLAGQARIMVNAGAQCVYVADSAGALGPAGVATRVRAVLDEIGKQAHTGFHGHQNPAMGVANSVQAYHAGARQVDGALLGLGAGPATRRLSCARPRSPGSGSPPESTSRPLWPRHRTCSSRSSPAAARLPSPDRPVSALGTSRTRWLRG